LSIDEYYSYIEYKIWQDEEQVRKENLLESKRKLELEQIQSVIDTNKSVKKNNLWIPLLTGALLIISVIGLWRQIKNENQAPQNEQMLQQQNIILESIENRLVRNDSILQKRVIDSLLKPDSNVNTKKTPVKQ
jgi:hypothetical protein